MENENNTLPKDWRIKRLGEVSTINNKTLTEKTDNNYSFFYLDLSSVKEGIIDVPKEKTVFKSAPSRARRILLKNNIVIATVRPNLKGFALIEFEPVDFICSTGFALISAPNIDDAKFIYQNFYGNYIEKQIENLVVGSSYPAINNSDVENLLIKYPNNQLERSKIALILSTWDEATQTTQNLIKKLETRKKGLMQNLLSGKKRLQGFSEDWKNVKLGSIFKERKETGYINLQLLAITNSNGVVLRNSLVKKDTSNEDKGKYLRICKGDIGYNTMRMWQGVSGVSEYEGIVSPAYTILIPSTSIDVYYMAYLFKYEPMIHTFWRYSQGLVDDTLNCKYDSLRRIEVLIPPIEEQTAIAKILNTADAELNETKAYLETLKQQKKGLMQQLLTGKIRVKTDG